MRQVYLLLVVILAIVVIWILTRRQKRSRRRSGCKTNDDCSLGQECQAGRCVVDLPFVPPPVPPPPSCTPPAKPSAPVVVKNPNTGLGSCPTNEVIDITITDQNIPNGIYIFQGTGQLGDVDNYMVAGVSPSYLGNLEMKCSSTPSQHQTLYIRESHRIFPVSDLPATSGTTATVTWTLNPDYEEYNVIIYGQLDGRNLYYGGFTTQGTITIPVMAGIPNQYAVVSGYKLCDKSPVSNSTPYTTSPP